MINKLEWETIGQMMDNMLTGIVFLKLRETKMEILYLNDGALRMLGYDRDGYRYILNLVSLIIDEDKDKFWQAIEDIMKDDGAVDVEFRTVTGSGGLRWIQVRGNLYERTADGAVILCTFMDATERKFVENELSLQSEHYEKLLDSDSEILFDYNARTDVMTMKTSKARDVSGDTIIDKYLEKMREIARVKAEEAKALEVMERLLRKPGNEVADFHISLREWEDPRWYRIAFTSIAGVDGYVTHIVGRVSDIQQQKEMEMALGDRERLDPLTGYLNSSEIKNAVDTALANASRNDIHAFILIDLSELRILKESLGEGMWSKLFRSITDKVGEGFKRSDIIGRYTDDELVLLVQDVESVANVDAVAGRVAKATQVSLGGAEGIALSGTVGVAIYPYQGKNFDDLCTKAEKAIVSLNAEDKKGYHIYNLSGVYAQEASESTGLSTDEADRDSVEDLLWQLLSDNTPNDNLTRAMIKMTARAYGFHKGYLSIEGSRGEKPLVFRYFEKGYEPKGQGPSDEEGNEAWFPVLRSMGLLGGIRLLHSYDTMPEEVSNYMIRNSIRTLVIRPIMARGELAGVFLLGRCTADDIKLTDSEFVHLRRVLQIIHMHALRYERERSGRPLLTHARLLDDFDSYVMEVDYDTYEVCFANRKMMEAMPELQIGARCYETYAGNTAPCPDCIMRKLGRDKAHDRCTEEMFSASMRKWLKVYASWVQNSASGATCLLNCIDISEYFAGGM